MNTQHEINILKGALENAKAVGSERLVELFEGAINAIQGEEKEMQQIQQMAAPLAVDAAAPSDSLPADTDLPPAPFERVTGENSPPPSAQPETPAELPADASQEGAEPHCGADASNTDTVTSEAPAADPVAPLGDQAGDNPG